MLPNDKFPFIIDKPGPEGKYILSRYACAKLLLAIQREGLLTEANVSQTKEVIKAALNFVEKYRLLFLEILDMLKRNEYIKLDGENIVTTGKVTEVTEVLENIKETIARQNQNEGGQSTISVIKPYIRLMDKTFPSFLKVAKGEMGYLSALFPLGDKTFVESIYKTNTQILFNKFIVHYSNIIVEELRGTKKKINILEIGAGTGGTTASVLPFLKEKDIALEYHYTDISVGMVRIGKKQFKESYDFVHYNLLDIDKDPEKQGFQLGYFDFVLCSNVLHATNNIERTLSNVKKLMANSNAYLLVNEIIDKLDFLTVTFGLTDGWWMYSDKYRKAHSPLLDIPTWKKLLTSLGLHEGVSTEKVEEISDLTSQNLFIYKS